MDAEPAQAGGDAPWAGGGPAEHLAALLARAQNAPPAAARLTGIGQALMHHSGLQSCRHTKGPPRQLNRRTYRHSFLLPDGGVRVLWELEHDTDPDGRSRSAVFADREELALAEWEVDAVFGASGGPLELPTDADALWLRTGADGSLGDPDGWAEATDGVGGLDGAAGSDSFDGSDYLGDAGAWAEPPGGKAPPRRVYTEGDSAEHAWRLLRRAANPGAPGQETRDRLRAAVAHGISIVTRRSTMVAGRLVCWSLYEHAFLMPDGSEVSLWEIDHTRTPSGDPVCEVYGSRDAALDTAVRRIEAG